MVWCVFVLGPSSLYPASRTKLGHGVVQHPGRLPERPMGADCKSVGLRLRRFESCTCHPGQTWYLATLALEIARAKGSRPSVIPALGAITRPDGVCCRERPRKRVKRHFSGTLTNCGIGLIIRWSRVRAPPAPPAPLQPHFSTKCRRSSSAVFVSSEWLSGTRFQSQNPESPRRDARILARRSRASKTASG